ncbi:hypothetical protein [Dyella sp.]|uniref:hypothetical protein n=1 Tax=Dyella sp. TaxID=1869338 RepID=UPI002B47736C|nr:hypothetical protein [Dyella sp.]HKT28102.1 hypothetical protein [Dyella sp.]
MSISFAFLLKHIRPFGTSGYDTFCSVDLANFLIGNLGLTLGDIRVLYTAWRGVALSDAQSAAIIDCAKDVANARWGQLQQTTGSTVMFLSGIQLQDLSNASLGQSFTWRPASKIAVAVRIDGGHGGHHARWDVEGFSGNTDSQGAICHFSDLV